MGSRPLQQRLEKLLRDRAAGFDLKISAALIVLDHHSGEVLAVIGSPDLFDTERQGYIDMTLALRSPGSTLKPLIYGLAFEAGLAHPESLVEDRPTAFGSYVPQNFDHTYRGTVSVRSALQLSLNIPAVTALDAVGPARLLARMRRAGLAPRLPPGGRAPGLAIGLGGLGLSLRDLVTLYAGIARGGTAVALVERLDAPRDTAAPRRFLSAGAAWQVADILAGVPAPPTAAIGRVAYKTGTSYGHRDAWAIGFDGRHVVGVWIGRPDGASAPGIAGIDQAAPLLFEAFGRLGGERVALSPPPPGLLTVSNAELPLPLRRLRRPGAGPPAAHSSPEIAFPPDGARVDLGLAAGMNRPGAAGLALAGLALKVRNGTPPFTWLVNGRPLDTAAYERAASWRPDGPGFISISVIDARGNSDRVRVFLQ